MPTCQTCGQQAPPEIQEMLTEANYSGDYFCNDECRDQKRSESSYVDY